MREPADESLIRAAALSLFAEKGYRATTMTDIGAAIGIRGPSLYKHVASKQELLSQIVMQTMHELLRDQRDALVGEGEHVARLRRMVEAHVRYHATHREEAFVGNREIANLEPATRKRLLSLRARYERALRRVLTEGCEAQVFCVTSPRLVSYAILDMGMGVSAWFRSDGVHNVDEIACIYADHAEAMVTFGC